MLKVYGKKYEDLYCARNSISDELFMSGKIERLEDEVKREYFKVK